MLRSSWRFLGNEQDRGADHESQSRSATRFLPEVVKALHTIYWDDEADDIKPGASGDGSGSIMHVEDLIGQFDLTFDISHPNSERLVSMLPSAFGKFKSATGHRGPPSTYRTRHKRRFGCSAVAMDAL